jgi:hypothetical protein
MKLIRKASGKSFVQMTKEEWETLGVSQGWMSVEAGRHRGHDPKPEDEVPETVLDQPRWQDLSDTSMLPQGSEIADEVEREKSDSIKRDLKRLVEVPDFKRPTYVSPEQKIKLLVDRNKSMTISTFETMVDEDIIDGMEAQSLMDMPVPEDPAAAAKWWDDLRKAVLVYRIKKTQKTPNLLPPVEFVKDRMLNAPTRIRPPE